MSAAIHQIHLFSVITCLTLTVSPPNPSPWKEGSSPLLILTMIKAGVWGRRVWWGERGGGGGGRKRRRRRGERRVVRKEKRRWRTEWSSDNRRRGENTKVVKSRQKRRKKRLALSWKKNEKNGTGGKWKIVGLLLIRHPHISRNHTALCASFWWIELSTSCIVRYNGADPIQHCLLMANWSQRINILWHLCWSNPRSLNRCNATKREMAQPYFTHQSSAILLCILGLALDWKVCLYFFFVFFFRNKD